MPSNVHEALVEAIRQQPGFAVQLLTDVAGVAVPTHTVVCEGSPDLSHAVPVEQRADTVVTLQADGVPVFGIITEVQLRVDPVKHYRWPSYVVALRNRLRCPVLLLVISTSDRVARWAARPIDLGAGSAIVPISIGPSVIPTITDPAVARAGPELALLSAVAHPADRGVLDALFSTFNPDIDRSLLYADLVRTVLPEAARNYLEHLMSTTTWRYQSDFARKYFDQGLAEGEAKGKAEGKAEDILAVLSARGITVADDARARITNCDNPDQLSTWLIKAVTATAVSDVLD